MEIEVRFLEVGMVVNGLKIVSIASHACRRYDFARKIGFQDNTGKIVYNVFDDFSLLNVEK